MTTSTGSVERTGWVGWVFFGGLMMIVGGLADFFYGLVGVTNDQWVVFGYRAAVYLDVTQWGWVHLILGVIVALAGVGVITGNVLARIIGVIVASVSLLFNFLSLPLYPFWSVTLMVIDALVIYALIAHGREVRA
jgi:hypothetical protein